jgi:hypothetical protein
MVDGFRYTPPTATTPRSLETPAQTGHRIGWTFTILVAGSARLEQVATHVPGAPRPGSSEPPSSLAERALQPANRVLQAAFLVGLAFASSLASSTTSPTASLTALGLLAGTLDAILSFGIPLLSSALSSVAFRGRHVHFDACGRVQALAAWYITFAFDDRVNPGCQDPSLARLPAFRAVCTPPLGGGLLQSPWRSVS